MIKPYFLLALLCCAFVITTISVAQAQTSTPTPIKLANSYSNTNSDASPTPVPTATPTPLQHQPTPHRLQHPQQLPLLLQQQPRLQQQTRLPLPRQLRLPRQLLRPRTKHTMRWLCRFGIFLCRAFLSGHLFIWSLATPTLRITR